MRQRDGVGLSRRDLLGLFALGLVMSEAPATAAGRAAVRLPKPDLKGGPPVARAIAGRRSERDYSDAPLSVAEVGQLLWAAQGITKAPRRAAPSAGATYPLETYLVAGAVEGLEPGVYRYDPKAHALAPVLRGDLRRPLSAAAVGQDWVRDGAAAFVLCAVYRRTAKRYGRRAERYVHMEAGAAAENVYLQAEALGIATVLVGAFRDDRVREVIDAPANQAPLAIMPLGRPR